MKSAKRLLAAALVSSAAITSFNAIALAQAATVGTATKVTRSDFGKSPDGAAIDAYTLKDSALEVKVITWGAHITSIKTADKTGAIADVVLGYGGMDASAGSGYVADKSTYMGSVVGRYGNRIAHGKFSLGGHEYTLPTNDHGKNTLHGGTVGFDHMVWTAKQVPAGVELTLVSNDGDQGFPGKLTAHVTYTLTGNKLKIAYSATTDKPTVINLTNHTYFNLAGSGDILNHVAMIDAGKFTPTDAALIPTGDTPSVEGTPFDFRKPTPIGARINAANDQLKMAGGYDHNWILTGPASLTHPAAKVVDPGSGRTLTVYTTEPGVQFYTGNFLDGSLKNRDGVAIQKHAGFCLETQHYPDSPNHPAFPTTTLNPGATNRTTTIFEFYETK